MSAFGTNTNTFGAGTSTGFGGASTGFSFGNTAPTSTAATGFGFTAPATTAAGGGGLFNFNQPTTTTAASTGFGFGNTGGFGAGTATGGFGTGTSTGFGTGTSTGFGAGTSTGFGTGTSTGFGAGTSTGFGAGTSTGFGTGTSTGFGTGTSTGGFGAGGTSFGGFGTGAANTGFTGFAQPQQQQQQQAVQQNSEAAVLTNMASAVSLPLIFGDERDSILAKWNQLQAFWGTGKGFYNQQGTTVNFDPDNPFCRFKAVGYCGLPSSRNADGMVGLVFNKPRAQVVANQQQAVDTLTKIINKPNMTVCVDGVKELPDDCTELVIYIQERLQTGATKKYPATEVYNFLNSAKAQLNSQLGVTRLNPKTGLAKDHLKQYLDNPPQGIDPLIWQQAKLDNPDPDKLLPVPIVGFSELHRRLKHQEKQTDGHNATLTMITNDIAALQRNHANMISKTEEYKRKHLELSHRVLKVIVKQEIYRKMGLGIHGDEEQLRVHLENIQAELNAPTQFKGRLNELMSQIRLQNQLGAARLDNSGGYQIEPALQTEIHAHLKQQQEGMQHLISIIKEDLDDLKLIEHGLQADTRR